MTISLESMYCDIVINHNVTIHALKQKKTPQSFAIVHKMNNYFLNVKKVK